MKRRIKYRPNKAVGAFGVVWGCVFILIGLLVVITVVNGYQAFGKKYIGPDITIEDEETKPARPDASFDPQATDHEHITEASYGHTPQKRMEQLETLKEAGLITEEEYREKRKEILGDL